MNKLLLPLVVVNYCIYRFYQRWEKDPVIYTVRLVALFFFINIITILFILQKTSVLVPNENYYVYTIPILLFLVIINYLLIFKDSKHNEYFFIVSHGNKKELMKRQLFIIFYLAITIIPITAILANKFIGTP